MTQTLSKQLTCVIQSYLGTTRGKGCVTQNEPLLGCLSRGCSEPQQEGLHPANTAPVKWRPGSCLILWTKRKWIIKAPNRAWRLPLTALMVASSLVSFCSIPEPLFTSTQKSAVSTAEKKNDHISWVISCLDSTQHSMFEYKVIAAHDGNRLST